MNTQQNMEDRLWDFIDGTCTEADKSFIQQLVETNLEWKAKYNELLEVHQLMKHSLELDEPSLRFRQNVMEEIARYQIAPATRTYINKNIVRGIAAFFIIMVVGFIISGFAQVNWASGSDTFLPDLGKIEWNKFFSSTYTNIFLMVNIILGLILLDMYLNKKKKQFSEKFED